MGYGSGSFILAHDRSHTVAGCIYNSGHAVAVFHAFARRSRLCKFYRQPVKPLDPYINRVKIKEVRNMRRKMIKWAFSLAAAALTLFASINVASACTWMWYQPELPEALREK
jgi:cyclic lactone autoinducer peptide